MRFVPGAGTYEHLWRTLTLRRLHEINLSLARHPPLEWFAVPFFEYEAPVQMAADSDAAGSTVPEALPLYE